MSPVTHRQLTHAMDTKVTTSFGNGRERSAWIEYRGVKLLHLTIPKVHRNDVKEGTLRGIQEDLELADADFLDLCMCPFTREDFQRHLAMILLARKRPPLRTRPCRQTSHGA